MKRDGTALAIWPRILGYFLGTMLTLTILSRAADSIMLPVVKCERPFLGTLTHTVVLSGAIEAREQWPVMAESGLAVARVYVRAGQTVKEGEVLLSYDAEALQRKLDEQQVELMKLIRQAQLDAGELPHITTQDADNKQDTESTKVEETKANQAKPVSQQQISDLEIDIAQRDVNRLFQLVNANAMLASPVDGTIIELIAKPGGTVSDAALIISPASSGLVVRAAVTEEQAKHLAPGMEAKFQRSGDVRASQEKAILKGLTMNPSTSVDLSQLGKLHPDIGWTAYVQYASQLPVSDTVSTRTAKAALLLFLGSPNRIMYFPLVSGRLPYIGERGACALDKGTALRLFGSINLGEVSVRLDSSNPVRVVGVMDVNQPLVISPAADVDVLDRLAADDRETLLQLMRELNVEPDPFRLSGAELSKFAWLMCAVPWLLAAILILISLRDQGGHCHIASTMLLWALSLGAFLVVLWSIPVRLLPTRWSDLGFYSEQFTALKSRPFRAPDVRDELLKLDMLRVGILTMCACIALWLERKWIVCRKSH